MAAKKSKELRPPPPCARCGAPATSEVGITSYDVVWEQTFDGSHNYGTKTRSVMHFSLAACGDCARDAARVVYEYLGGRRGDEKEKA